MMYIKPGVNQSQLKDYKKKKDDEGK